MEPTLTCDFLLAIHSNRGGLSHTVSQINCDFNQKSQFFTAVYLTPPRADGVPVGIW